MTGIFLLIDSLLRGLVLGAAGLTGVVALTHWAVRRGHLPSRTGPAPFVWKLSDPALRPIERGLLRRGRNPQEAPLWLFGLVVVLGILVLSLWSWIGGVLAGLLTVGSGGPRATVAFVINFVVQVLTVALMVRVIGSWFGAGRHGPLRLAWWLTDWLVLPIQRRLPPFGVIDLSPLVAYVALLLLRGVLLMLL